MEILKNTQHNWENQSVPLEQSTCIQNVPTFQICCQCCFATYPELQGSSVLPGLPDHKEGGNKCTQNLNTMFYKYKTLLWIWTPYFFSDLISDFFPDYFGQGWIQSLWETLRAKLKTAHGQLFNLCGFIFTPDFVTPNQVPDIGQYWSHCIPFLKCRVDCPWCVVQPCFLRAESNALWFPQFGCGPGSESPAYITKGEFENDDESKVKSVKCFDMTQC